MEDERISWITHNSYIQSVVGLLRKTLHNAYSAIVEVIQCNPVQNCIKNGYYIPTIHASLYYMTGDAFVSTSLAMKLYPANYFYWFGEYYDFRIPKKYNWVKQFVRFTDTGYMASYIYILYPDFLPVTYNVHFLITFGYWFGKQTCKMDMDLYPISGLNKNFVIAWSDVNHGIHWVLLTYKIISSDMCSEHFTLEHLKWSYYWLYAWFFAIYLPWRIMTGDCVYEIFASDTPWSKKIAFVGIMHLLIALGNTTGYLLR
jgi:hypothetical protein